MIVKAPITPVLADIRAVAERLAPYITRSPMLPLRLAGLERQIFLKLENLQAIGAFKARPTGSVLLSADPATLRDGIYTASSGNAGLGLAWMAKRLGLAVTVYAPDSAPGDKLEAIRRLGAQVRSLSDQAWWQIIESGTHASDPGLYIDAVRHPAALAGNATIGLEIVEQCPNVETVIVPFGGGGLSCGIASAMRALKPDVRIVVAESEAATPLTAALQAGQPTTVETQPSFISGAGAPSVLPEMWPLVSDFIAETIVVSVAGVADAIRLLFMRNKVIAEGAGAIALAALLTAERDFGTTVCVVSGGNIDPQVMAAILRQQTP